MASVTPVVDNELFSHGTIECTDLKATRRFLTEFLGLDIIRPLKEAQYMWKGGPWSVVCVCVEDGEAKDQDPRNHFKLAVSSPEEVDAAHAAALKLKDDYGIQKIEPVMTENGVRAFLLQDLNKHWWQIANVSQAYYDALFERGDAVN
jgi:catechol 2,3-dioxygenase-like lactoylglutathione lyase family enzyme